MARTTDPADPRVRQAVLDLLREGSDPRFQHSYLPSAIRGRTGCALPEAMEALWALVGEGLVYLDPSGQAPDNWRWALSAAGRSAVSGGSWEPRDMPGYLARLRREAPELDAVALRYVEEALRSFGARCYLASTVMLGVAAEQVFNHLAEAFVSHQRQPSSRLQRTVDTSRGVRERFVELRRHLEPIRHTFPEDLRDVLTLDAVGDLLRIARNEAGHPTGIPIDEDTARTHLLMAATYLRKMSELAAHFRTLINSP